MVAHSSATPAAARRPRVSVIVPCFRYGHYVRECVLSVLNQDVALDVLVVDDASPDDSWEIVRELPRLSGQVRVHRNPANVGLIGTVNAGLAEAAGEFVVVLSADDVLAPGALRRAADALQAVPDAAFAYGPVRHLVAGRLVGRPRPRGTGRVLAGRDWAEAVCRAGRNPVWSPEVVARTSAQRAVGGYRPYLPYTSDLEMWLRLASVGRVVALGGPEHAYYRVHSQNMSRGPQADDLRNLQLMLDAYVSWASGTTLPEAGQLLDLARTALAEQALRHARRALDLGRRDTVTPAELAAFALRTQPRLVGGQAHRAVLRRGAVPRAMAATLTRRAAGVARQARTRNAA